MMQQQRQRAEAIIHGLETKSARIRALAQAGYDRTEISKLVGVRYQQVRQVLVHAGINGGLRRRLEVQREPVAVESSPATPELTSWEGLLHAGFEFLGEWTLDADGTIKLDGKVPVVPGVYVFVIDESVAYVGLASAGLRTRFDHYQRGHKRHPTNNRVRGLIIKALSDGHRVKSLFAKPASSDWNGLPVYTAAGLEAGLIEMMRPPWNILGSL